MSYRIDSPRIKYLEHVPEKCPRCGKGPVAIDRESGEFYCTNCGFVIKEKVEEVGPEWRSFSLEEREERERAGAPTSVASHDMGLATVIGVADRDASGKALPASIRSTVQRMRTWDKRSQVYESFDRNLRTALLELRTFAEKLGLSEEAIEKAAYIYRKALERGLLRGRAITSMAAAALYAACRDMQIPRTLKDIAEVSNLKRKSIARDYRILLKELDIKMPVPNPIRTISRIASAAGVSEKTKRRAIEILTKAIQNGVSAGKDPMGLAAAALYIATALEGEGITQDQLARAAGVTQVTIRNRYKGLVNALGIGI